MSKALAGIEYAGTPGVTEPCERAVLRLLQYNERIEWATILTTPGKGHSMLLSVNPGDLLAIKSGFASGYVGEGSRRFAYTLLLLNAHGIELKECKVKQDLADRLDESALTKDDIEFIEANSHYARWSDYVELREFEWEESGRLWSEFNTVVPFSIIDTRIIELAVSFQNDPEKAIFTAYKRLEDIVRERTGSNSHGVEVFSEAFLGKEAVLTWKDLDRSEQEGRGHLFRSTYMAHRNRLAHRETKHIDREAALSEFLLINHLYRLEKEAVAVALPPVIAE